MFSIRDGHCSPSPLFGPVQSGASFYPLPKLGGVAERWESGGRRGGKVPVAVPTRCVPFVKVLFRWFPPPNEPDRRADACHQHAVPISEDPGRYLFFRFGMGKLNLFLKKAYCGES